MNTSSIIIWYDTGSCDEIHLLDPSYSEGATLMREYIDVTDPDEGIFVERTYIAPEDVEEAAPGGIGYRQLVARNRVVGPGELEAALLVLIHGVPVLRRQEGAGADCGLAVVSPESLGFSPVLVDTPDGRDIEYRYGGQDDGEGLMSALDDAFADQTDYEDGGFDEEGFGEDEGA